METYYGHVRTPADAIILFEACRIGLLPRVQRRLSEKERQSIRSGSVFVWDEREAGMRRWTDGKSWSASRVSGSFLTYREMEGKRGGTGVSQSSNASRAGKTPESTRGSDDDRADGGDEGPDGYRYKPDGLMKQSFSITTSAGQHLHLISYYSRSHPLAANLQQPSTDPALRHVRPQKGLYPESTVNDQQNLPVVTRGPMAGATYSITRHPMTGYPRSGATHPQSYTPPYAWPPTPLATPPAVPVPYSASYLPPLSSANGQVPYSQHHHHHQQQQQQHHPAPALPPPPPQPGLHPPYDRPVPQSETTMAPSIPPSTAPAPALPAFATRSPRVSDIHDPHPRSPPNYVDHRLASPRIPAHTLPPSNGAAPAMRSPHSLKQVSTPPHYAPPAVTKPLEITNSSSETSVPSIGALMNSVQPAAPPPLPVSTAAPAPAVIDAPRIRPLPRAGGSPLIAGRATDGPKDIPSEKIGFGGEDMRALRQLDRVFI